MSEGTHTNNLLPPFSEDLREDAKIEYSKKKLKETIMFWLRREKSFDKTKIDKLKVVANYPALHIFAKLAKKAYENYDEKEVKKYEQGLPEEWKLLTTATNDEKTNGYYGAAYLNPKQQQVIIAHRGTIPSKIGPLWTDLIGVVFNKSVPQMDSAVTFTNFITSVLNNVNDGEKINLQLFFTGHSLGGWLAQITTFTAKYLALNHNNYLFEKAGQKGYHGHAVVFESPGCQKMLDEMQYTYTRRHDNTCAIPIDITSLDITSYLTVPNLINTFNYHLGTIYRISVDLSDLKTVKWYHCATHEMNRILNALASNHNLEITEILDWPVCTVFERELRNFFMWSKQFYNYDPDVNSEYFQAEISKNFGHCPIRYQNKIVEENKRSVNVFSQAEQLFLGRYQELCKLPYNLKQNIFSDINDEDARKEITERLQSFEIDNKNISCDNKEELQKFIPFVNALLYFFPEIQTKINDALTATGISEAIIDSHSQNYHEDVSKDFPHFTDDEELKTLIGDIKQVSLISDDKYTSLGFARICKAFAENATHETAKHVILSLERVLYLKELLSNFEETMANFVEEPSKNKSLIFVECTVNFNVEHNKEFTGKFFNCIFKILETPSESKIILVTHSRNEKTLNEMVCQKTGKLKLEYAMKKIKPLTWDNLSSKFHEDLWKRQLIVFEGQKETSLKELIGENNATYKEIVSDQEILMKLINNDKIMIEITLPIPGDFDFTYYIERTLYYEIEIKKGFFENKQKKDLFVISGTDKSHLESLEISADKIRLFQESDPDKNSMKLVILDNQKPDDDFKQLCIEYSQYDIHWLRFKSDKLIWQQTHGSLSGLYQYIEKGEVHARKYSETELLNKKKNIMIISDKAGMGKSTILTYLKHKIKKCDPTLWIIQIDLNNYTSQLRKQKEKGDFQAQDPNENINLAIQFLTQDLVKFDKSSIKVLFQHGCLRNIGKMIVMFDGFDEISPDYKELVIALVQALRKSAIKQIWITTRPNMRNDLENAFQEFAYTLKSFSEYEQQDFLTKFWQGSENHLNEINKDRLQIFAKALIEQLATSISDKDVSFTGIPLQIRMLAEAFKKESTEFCKSEEPKPELLKKLDLIDLYEQFFTHKYNIYQVKKIKLELSKPSIKRQCIESYSIFIEQHQKMALYAIFKEKKSIILLEEKFFQEFSKGYPEVAKDILQHEEKKQLLLRDMNEKLQFHIEDIKEGKLNVGIIDEIRDGVPHFIHRTFSEYLIAKYLVDSLGNKKIAEFVLQEILMQPDYQVLRAFVNGLLVNNTSDDVLQEYGELIERLWLEDENNLYYESNTFLHIAAEENNAMIASFLLDSVRKHNKKVLKILLEQPNKNSRKYTPLLLAAEKGNLEVVKCLVENEVNIHAKNDNGDTILHRIVPLCTLKVLKFLIGKGANVDAINKKCENVLHTAALYGKLEVLQCLVDNGADINVQRKNGETLLHWAALQCKLETVDYLVEKVADIDAKKTNGETPLHWAALYGRLEVVKILVEKGANVNALKRNHTTVLHKAARSGKLELMQYLVQKGANVIDNINGKTLLHSASRSGKSEVVQYLVQGGANVNAIKKNGKTVLHNAAMSGNLEVIQYLVKNGADINAIKKNDKKLPYSAKVIELLRNLEDKKANVNLIMI